MSVQTRTTALQNEIVRLYFTFENDGYLSNPMGQPLVEILDTDGATVLDSVNAQREHDGIYYADWFVPQNLPLGNYYDRWTFQWDPNSGVKEITTEFSVHTFDTYVNFVAPSIDHDISDRLIQMMKDLTNDFIFEAMHIPVYWEQAMRVQQEDQQKRIKSYYYFHMDSEFSWAEEGDVYFEPITGQRFTVFETFTPSEVSSSSSSESIGNVSSSSSSSSSIDSSSSSSNGYSSSSSSSSSTSESGTTSSSSQGTTTTTTTAWVETPILTCVGISDPSSSGTLTKISGEGSDRIAYTIFTKKVSRFSTKYSLAYNNWNMDPKPIIRINNRIVDDGWKADYNGMIYFDRLMAPEDSVNVAYNFSYFSTEEILAFLRNGLEMMNATPPSSWKYQTLNIVPWDWTPGILLWAAILALKRLIFGLNFQEKRLIYGTPDEIQFAMQNFQDLYKSYFDLWNEIRESIKKQLPATALYVSPEYTLPGGRSRWFRYLYKSGA